jgi:uncharacterized repeat protein (TIGR01451 family)
MQPREHFNHLTNNFQRKSLISFSYLGTLVLLTAMAMSSAAFAAHPDLAEYWCAEDVSNVGNCSANEVSIANVTNVEIEGNPTSCTQGEVIQLNTLTAELDANTGERFDPTIWIGRFGNDPRLPATSTSCRVTSLPDNTGSLDILDLESGQDACLDLQQPAVPIQFTASEPTQIVCNDSDGDGQADVQVLITWWQNKNFVCAVGDPGGNLNDPYFSPGSPSKCDYTVINFLDLQIVENPDMSIVKSVVSVTGGSADTAGDIITYSVLVTNTGDTPLTNVEVGDPIFEGYNQATDCTVALPAGLAPAASVTCTGTYTLTQADLDSNGNGDGDIDNQAFASADEVGVINDTAEVPLAIAPPTISLTKTGTLNDDDGTPGPSAGDTISYVFVVQNTGSLTLTDVTITDPDALISGGPIASLAPAAIDDSTFTGTYTLTQSDVNAGTFTNTATVNSFQGATDQDSDTQTWTPPTVIPPPAPRPATPVSTLNDVGLALLALLMLGVGIVGYRRLS